MKNSTIVYIATLGISLALSLIMFQRFDYWDDWVSWFYISTTVIISGTIITAFLKDNTSKNVVLPILSVFVLLSALGNLYAGTSILIFNQTNEYIGGELLLPLHILFQIGLLVYAIKHILPQPIENVELEEYETIEM
jgi:hypothetical protein